MQIMRFERITHIALELSSPTRMERYLHDLFGLQLLSQGYWKGEYVRVMGSPSHQRTNPPILILYNRPFIPRGRLRHLAVAVDMEIEDAVAELRRQGHQVDGEDILTAPGGLRVKVDHLTRPRPAPQHDPSTKMVASPVDAAFPCLVRGIHHVALDVPEHAPLLAWTREIFGMDFVQMFDRRGEFIATIKYRDGPVDAVGRRPGFTPLFLRHGNPGATFNHVAFDFADADAAIGELEARGATVDLPQDAMIHGPEETWYQIDSRDTPYAIGHPANDPGVPLFPYRYD
jgi:catechol 2,3-dioxygenase-like lactoylglutathione lyase family enzyme